LPHQDNTIKILFVLPIPRYFFNSSSGITPTHYPFDQNNFRNIKLQNNLLFSTDRFSIERYGKSFIDNNTVCHSRESGNPLNPLRSWIPAFAGMTARFGPFEFVILYVSVTRAIDSCQTIRSLYVLICSVSFFSFSQIPGLLVEFFLVYPFSGFLYFVPLLLCASATT
jgi:hypothetical protein